MGVGRVGLAALVSTLRIVVVEFDADLDEFRVADRRRSRRAGGSSVIWSLRIRSRIEKNGLTRGGGSSPSGTI